MKSGFQTTLRRRVSIDGVGVHSAAPAQLVLHPAEPDTGVTFLRTGLPDGRERLLEGARANVTQTALCTILGDASGASISTVEHLLAALSGLQIDNVLVEIDGPETPIMDGSAADFVEAIDRVGVVQQARPRRHLKVLKPVRVEHDGGFAEFLPAERGFRLDVEIDFDSPAIGRQRRAFDLDPGAFRREIARARTFGFVSDVKKLWQAGFALGSSLENSVAIDGDAVLNPEGLRYADEFVRHKALDAVGDLSLAGAPIIGVYRTYRPGHKLNALALEALFADRSAYAFVEARRRQAASARVSASGACAGRRGFRRRRLDLSAPAFGSALRRGRRAATFCGHSRRISRGVCAAEVARAPGLGKQPLRREATGGAAAAANSTTAVEFERMANVELGVLSSSGRQAAARAIARGGGADRDRASRLRLLDDRPVQSVRRREIQDGDHAGRAGEQDLRSGPREARQRRAAGGGEEIHRSRQAVSELGLGAQRPADDDLRQLSGRRLHRRRDVGRALSQGLPELARRGLRRLSPGEFLLPADPRHLARPGDAARRRSSAFQEIVKKYPKSEYVEDSKFKITVCHDQLAGKEMSIGRFYLNRHNYTAAINRFRNVLQFYQTSRHAPEALYRLVEAYLGLGITDEAQTAAAVLGHNFPDSQWYQDAFDLLKGKGLSPAGVSAARGSRRSTTRSFRPDRSLESMLARLSIRDVVLIDQLDLEFSPGLTILTGETGAGKSILLDALSLALGARGDGGLVRHGQAQGQVTAVFELPPGHAAHALLEGQDIEIGDELILRRVQLADGRTRAYVNDQSVSAQALRALASSLVEIHGQHDERALTDPSTHRALVDAYGGLDPQSGRPSAPTPPCARRSGRSRPSGRGSPPRRPRPISPATRMTN